MQVTVLQSGVDVILEGKGRVIQVWVKGCEGVCRISHDGPITTSTAAPTAITTPIDSGRACILDTRLGCAVFAPLHFVIEAQIKDGKWVRVAEGKWPTEECIVDINWSDFEGHCTDIRTYYEALLLPLTKEVGGKPRRLSSVIRPPFLVSEAHPNGYVLPNMYRLEFFLWGHTNLVFLPGLHMGGMGPDSCVLVLQDLMHVVLFETHLAPRKVLSYLAGDHRLAGDFSPEVLAFLDTDGIVIFREIMQEHFGDERFWMFQRRWCEAEYLNQKAHNGREQYKLRAFQVHMLCALVLHKAGFRTREERDQLLAMVKVGYSLANVEILKGIEQGDYYKDRFLILYTLDDWVPAARCEGLFGRLMLGAFVYDSCEYLCKRLVQDGPNSCSAMQACIEQLPPTPLQRRLPSPAEYMLPEWMFNGECPPEAPVQHEPLPDDSTNLRVVKNNGITEATPAIAEGLDRKLAALVSSVKNNDAQNADSKVAASAAKPDSSNIGVQAAPTLAELAEAPVLPELGKLNKAQRRRIMQRQRRIAGKAVEPEAATAKTGVDEATGAEAIAAALTNGADSLSSAHDTVRAHIPVQEANEPTTPLLESGTAAPLTPLSDGHPLLQLSDVQQALAEPIGQDTTNATARGPCPPQEHLPAFRAASPSSVPTIAPEVHEVFAPAPVQPLAVVPVISTVDMARGQAATSPRAPVSELATAQAPSTLPDATTTTTSMAVARPLSAATPAATSEALGVSAVPPSPPASPVLASALPLLSDDESIEQNDMAAGLGMSLMSSPASTSEASPFSPAQQVSVLSRSLPSSPTHASSSLRRTLSLNGNGFSSAVEILVDTAAALSRGGRVVNGPLPILPVSASEPLPTLSTQDDQDVGEHVAITVAHVIVAPELACPEDGAAPAHVAIDMRGLAAAARLEEDTGAPAQSFWSCMWSSVQNAWIYIRSCAHDAAVAVASWLSPSYWMGSGEGGQEASNAAEAGV